MFSVPEDGMFCGKEVGSPARGGDIQWQGGGG